jgi:hypothetical protein
MNRFDRDASVIDGLRQSLLQESARQPGSEMA